MPNAHQAQPEFVLQLDRPRKLVLSLGSLARAEEKLGKSLFQAVNWKRFGIADVRIVLWAALLEDDPNITFEDVDKLFTIQALSANFDTLRQLVETVISRALPSAEAEERKDAGKRKKKTRAN